MGNVEVIIDVESKNYLAFIEFIGKVLSEEQLAQVWGMLKSHDKLRFTFSPEGQPSVKERYATS